MKSIKITPGVYVGLFDGIPPSNTQKIKKPIIRRKQIYNKPIDETYNVFFGEHNTDIDGIYFLLENGNYIHPENIN